MALTDIEGLLTGPTGKQAKIRFLVDSGATYTLVPAEESRLLEIEAEAHGGLQPR